MIKTDPPRHLTEVVAVPGREVPQVSIEAPQTGTPAEDSRLLKLVTDHHAGTWRFLRRLGLAPEDADDALQEVILITARKLAGVRRGNEASFLFGTALRVARRALRRRSRRAEVDLAEVENDEPGVDVLVEQRQRRALLDRILASMPEDLRTVFVLYEIEGFTMAEIAEVLNIPSGTVASRLRRGRTDFEQRVARIEARGRQTGGRQ
ncbi:MAG: sigma-70 family RNA polymerase sigma factor [Polyangiaceae bacterium]|nr:sigma-70 family RNA polymerase sigma factor [Polyangiaceae bacterium]